MFVKNGASWHSAGMRTGMPSHSHLSKEVSQPSGVRQHSRIVVYEWHADDFNKNEGGAVGDA